MTEWFWTERFLEGMATVGVVERLRAVDGDAHQETVLAQKLTPFVSQQGAVRLQTIVDLSSAGIFLLQFQSLAIEREGAQQRLSAMPGE